MVRRGKITLRHVAEEIWKGLYKVHQVFQKIQERITNQKLLHEQQSKGSRFREDVEVMGRREVGQWVQSSASLPRKSAQRAWRA